MKQHKLPAPSCYQQTSHETHEHSTYHFGRHSLPGSFWHALLDIGRLAPSYPLYLLYLAGLFLLKFDYSAQSLNFLWSAQEWTRYGMLVLSAAFSCTGLMAARHCLDLPAPVTFMSQSVRLVANLGLAILLLCVALGEDAAAVSVSLALLGLWLLATVWSAARAMATAGAAWVSSFFFLATLCTIALVMLCVLLALNQLMPDAATYQLLQLGLIAEMSLLALALAQQARRHRIACVKAEHLACHDSLTNLYNRRAFLQMAKPIWSNAQRNGRPLSMIMIDLDHFKRINDQHGHEAGDRALEVSAALFEQACRGGDLLCRWGGEEFLMLLPETDMDQACVFAERVRGALERLGLPVESQSIFLTASFGVAESAGKSSLEDLIKAADLRLYDAKTHGRNRISSEQDAFFNSVLRA